MRRSLTPDEIKLVQVISFRTGVIPSREKARSHCRKNRSTCSVRQCCFDIVASMDGALCVQNPRDVDTYTSHVSQRRQQADANGIKLS